jgi:hypothetical protein
MTSPQSDESLEPRSDRLAEIAQLASIFGGTVSGREAVYVSTPITSGQRFAVWHAEQAHDPEGPSYRLAHAQHVVEPNRAKARELVARLRQSVRQVVIDPTGVSDFEGWNQADYRVLWAQVIDRYVERIVFVDGWAHSNGCAYEFLIACRRGISMSDQRDISLSAVDGLDLIRRATGELVRLRQDVSFLSWVVREVENVANPSANVGAQ